MASRLLRRSGVAVGLIVELLDWRADEMWIVGVGQTHQEVDVLVEEWPGLRTIGFEPNPISYKQILDQGDIDDLHELALGNNSGYSTLYYKNNHKDGSALFHHKDDEGCKEAMVQVGKLDWFCDPNMLAGKRILLWLDCEGSELEVLKGGEDFLQFVQVVNIEMTANPPGIGWCNPNEVDSWLKERGFYRQWIHTQRTHAGQYDAIYVRECLFKVQYCCVPEEVTRHQQRMVS